MAISDKRLLLSDNQNVVSAAIVESSSTIDLQSLRSHGQGDPLFVRFVVTEAFVAGAGTPKLTTMTHTASAGGANWYLTSGIETHYATGGVDLALAGTVFVPAGMQAAVLTVGKTWYMPLSPMNYYNANYPLGQRYFGVTYWQWGYNAVSQYFSAGKVTADIVDITAMPKVHYPVGYTA